MRALCSLLPETGPLFSEPGSRQVGVHTSLVPNCVTLRRSSSVPVGLFLY